MVVLPPAVSFWAMKAAWSDEMCCRVVLTLGYHRSNGCETSASCELFGAGLRGALVAIRVKRVHALTIGVSTRCHAVRRYQIVSVTVTVLFLRSFHCARDRLDSCRAYFHYCHNSKKIVG